MHDLQVLACDGRQYFRSLTTNHKFNVALSHRRQISLDTHSFRFQTLQLTLFASSRRVCRIQTGFSKTPCPGCPNDEKKSYPKRPEENENMARNSVAELKSKDKNPRLNLELTFKKMPSFASDNFCFCSPRDQLFGLED